MRPALKRQANTSVRTRNGALVDVSMLPDCKNCYNACALKIRCLDDTGNVAKKCAREV